MLQFLAGALLITAPPQVGVPVFLAANAVRALRTLRKREAKKEKRRLFEEHKKHLEPGKVQPVTLEWSGLTCTLTEKDGNKRVLLDNVSGVAKAGRLLAIMGPSGAGKTMLLNSLSGHLAYAPNLRLSGTISLNGEPAAPAASRSCQGYVTQEDLMYSMLTTGETLELAGELGLPHFTPDERKAYVDHLIGALGLGGVVDSRVGDAHARGLSGGEKKRLSLATELVGGPPLIFLDEPTTGLDSFQAEKVVANLRSLAAAGHTIVVSIHQPRSSIFAMFDDLVLVADGRIVYEGPANEVLDHFKALGFECPEHFNPAEFVADLISIDTASKETEATTRERLDMLVNEWNSSKAARESTKPKHHGSPVTDMQPETVGPIKQFKLLAVRSWRQVKRDKQNNMSRAFSFISSSLIFGTIFFRMQRKQSSIADRLGLLQICSSTTAMSSFMKTIGVFPRERLIISRERVKNRYQVLPYLLAKLVAELPVGALLSSMFGTIVYTFSGLQPNFKKYLTFLSVLTLESFSAQAMGLVIGGAAPTEQAALALGPAAMLLFIVFGGLYVNADNVPLVLRWLPQASLIRQAYVALCLNEFKGIKFQQDDNGRGAETGEQVLHALNFGKYSVPGQLMTQAKIMLFFYWASYAVLTAGGPKFVTLEAPPQEE